MAMLVENNLSAINQIWSGTNVIGNTGSESDIRIEGLLKGNKVTRRSLIIRQGGTVEGDLRYKSGEIEGQLNGVITVEDSLLLKSTSKFTGVISIAQLLIERTAIFQENCQMNRNK